MSIPAAMGFTLAVVVVYMTLGWLLSLPLRDASVIDPFWGLGCIVAALSYLLFTDGFSGRALLVLALQAAAGLAALAPVFFLNL